MTSSTPIHSLMAGLAVGFSGTVLADSTAPTPGSASPRSELVSPWKITGAFNLALADGNADTLSYSLQLLSSYTTPENEVQLGANYFFADDNGEDTTNSLKLFGQYNRLLTDRFYYGAYSSFLSDQITGLDSRIDVSSQLGYYLLKGDKTTLALEAGPGYAWEDQDGVTSNFATFRFAERFEYKFTANTKFWQSLSLTPRVDDFSDYLLNFEAGIDTRLTRSWALRTFVRHQLDSTPAEGQGRSDTSLLVGLTYTLGGIPESSDGATKASPSAPGGIHPAGWTTTAAAGLTVAKGNADNLLANFTFDTAYREPQNEYLLTGAFNYGENADTTSLENYRLTGQYNRLLTERFYYGGNLSVFRDDLADIDYRIIPTALVGYYVVKEEDTSLAFEAGPAWTFEKAGGAERDYVTLFLGEKFAHAFHERARFKQTLVVTPDPSDFDNFILTATAALDADITDNLAWRIALGYAYDNQPAEDREHHDTTLTTGVAVTF